MIGRWRHEPPGTTTPADPTGWLDNPPPKWPGRIAGGLLLPAALLAGGIYCIAARRGLLVGRAWRVVEGGEAQEVRAGRGRGQGAVETGGRVAGGDRVEDRVRDGLERDAGLGRSLEPVVQHDDLGARVGGSCGPDGHEGHVRQAAAEPHEDDAVGDALHEVMLCKNGTR